MHSHCLMLSEFVYCRVRGLVEDDRDVIYQVGEL